MEKYEGYLSLVERAKNDYEICNKDNGIPLRWCGKTCKEINLWTYWQGRNFFKQNNVKRIKYLLVGQDWGNPLKLRNQAVINNIERMNKGEEGVHYFSDVKVEHIFFTDKKLAELFGVLGYQNIDKIEYDDLFFTNFCLGYREGKQSGGLTISQMLSNNDMNYFLELCKILEPENILCLGKNVLCCVYKAFGIDDKDIKNINYNDYLNKKLMDNLSVDQTVEYNGIVSNIHGVAHCGSYGINVNRKPPQEPSNNKLIGLTGMELQALDWKLIKEQNKGK